MSAETPDPEMALLQRISGGLAGACFVALVQILSIGNPSHYLVAASVLFSVAIPPLVVIWGMVSLKEPFENFFVSSDIPLAMGLFFTPYVFGWIGISLCFFHIWIPSGICFIVVVATISVTVHFAYKRNRIEFEQIVTYSKSVEAACDWYIKSLVRYVKTHTYGLSGTLGAKSGCNLPTVDYLQNYVADSFRNTIYRYINQSIYQTKNVEWVIELTTFDEPHGLLRDIAQDCNIPFSIFPQETKVTITSENVVYSLGNEVTSGVDRNGSIPLTESEVD